MPELAREPSKTSTTATYRASREEVAHALGVHIPAGAEVSWQLTGPTLEIFVYETK